MRAEPVLVGDRVMHNERFDPVGMRDRKPESHRAAVVLYQEGVTGSHPEHGRKP
jgi:hypothetical protein